MNLDIHPLLPAAPFRSWLAARLLATGDTLDRFARLAGVDAVILCRILTGQQASVHVNVVDRALTRVGSHLVELYPELYPEMDFNLFGEMYEVAA